MESKGVTGSEIRVFDEQGLKQAFGSLGWKVDEQGLIRNLEEEVITCSVCGDALRKEELSGFFPGSTEPICSHVECILSARAKYMRKEE